MGMGCAGGGGPKTSNIIQGRMQTRKIDSKCHLIGFDYCVIAAQQRVLQHIPSESGHRRCANGCTLRAKADSDSAEKRISIQRVASSQ
jgi:hypothetical protein